MGDVTHLLQSAAAGDRAAGDELLPLVYDELRKLAAQKIADEKPGQTLEPTALVHEAYLRLVKSDRGSNWNGRGHFFAAAAEAMRRLLIERARQKKRLRHGGEFKRIDLDTGLWLADDSDDRLLALDDALARFAEVEPEAAEVVKLRYFAGCTSKETAAALDISVRTVNRHWTYARAWLYRELNRT
jgi:RNA polymerase sigma factor (TIGR02999 family)